MVPSLALFAILVHIVGIGFTNALIALVIYSPVHPDAERRDRSARGGPGRLSRQRRA
jgi:hypothetical protein